VFRLGEREPHTTGGLTFYASEYVDQDDPKPFNRYRVVDDRGVDKPTLGLRRLILKEQDVKLFPIGSAIYFLQDVIKLAKSTTWFIDSVGQVFQHKKLVRAKLQTHRITQVLPASGIGCVIEVEGLGERFKSLQVPKDWELYAGILRYNRCNLLYGYYSEPIKTTWRQV
jgi:hypothetical protein